MYEILFRGKRIDNDEWVEGYYVYLYDTKGHKTHRIYTGYAETDCGDYYPEWFEIDPETVGRYTGHKDKNGKPIFEGDIIAVSNGPVMRFNSSIIEIAWDDYVYGFSPFEYVDCRVHINEYGCRVIGNIYDNPNLLEKPPLEIKYVF